MLDFPATTLFNRNIPKSKFYENLTLSPAIKVAFVNEIERIVWRNKLSSATLNVQAGTRISEIEVLEISLKHESLNEAVLKLIDKGIPYHILFLLKSEEQYMACMGFKDLSDRTISEYYKTEWMAFEDLPLWLEGLSLDDVYDNFVRQLNTRLAPVTRGTLKDAVLDDAKRKKMEQQIARLEKQMRTEKQPKRKFEIYERIQEMKYELSADYADSADE